MTKTRFCPSPTGHIHLGNARTALLSALKAQHDNGVFLLRIEDTDPERSRDEYVQAVKEDLTWLGSAWQEGLDCGGDHEPYFQSQRNDIYEKYYQLLMDKGLAYPCYCTEEELDLSRKLQRRRGIAPRYAGTCTHLTEGEKATKLEEGRKPTLRFQVPKDAVIEFTDLVRGAQSFQSDDIGDFIIRRGDGGSTFMFCNAIDDALMGVNLALRGEDHLTNSPRQIMILNALDLPVPQYGHISLIVGSDGSPFSKRHGSKSIAQLREDGYLSIALVNYLARLGHTYVNHNELMTYEQCAEFFSMDHLVKASAKFDEKQLLHWQKEAVSALSDEALMEWFGNDVLNELEQPLLFAQTIKPNCLFPDDAMQWKVRLFSDNQFNDAESDIVKTAGKAFFETAIAALETADDFKGIANTVKVNCNVKGKQLFMPLRLAMTGVTHGPEMGLIFDLLGKEALKGKFEHVLEGIA
jgi:nondiscriminating glutamyl-tRNA synthetase